LCSIICRLHTCI